MDIQTPTKIDNVNKRPFSEVGDMQVDEKSSRKRTKATAKDKVIVDLEEEESINQGDHATIIQEEKEQSMTNTKETISKYTYEALHSQSIVEIQQCAYSDAQSHMFKSKEELISQYVQKKKQYVEENHKLLIEARKVSREKVSLIIVKDPKKSTLNFDMVDDNKVLEIKNMMD